MLMHHNNKQIIKHKVGLLKCEKENYMLLPSDGLHPEDTVYYNATFVINALNEFGEQHIMDVYIQIKRIKNMPISMFILCLNWLYLLDFISVNFKQTCF